MIALRLGFIVSLFWKIMHGLCALSAKDRVQTGKISVRIKASLTNKLSEISTACLDYTPPPPPALTTHASITIIAFHFGCQNGFSWRFAHQMYVFFCVCHSDVSIAS
jgi:hypothetical protein